MLQSPFLGILVRLHQEFAAISSGEPASYIPELAKANPAHFGISVVTADGTAYSVGDANVPFTLQSISKPLVYGLALDDNGADFVDGKVGVEPSGEAFNAISLEPGSGRPRNPMINAGAIAMSSLVAGESATEKFARTLAMLSRYAGRDLDVDEAVFRSEQETGHRNRAIGHLLRNAGIIEGEVDPVCDRYFRQCAVNVTCEDLAMMAATLANQGINPRTHERVVGSENVERILSVMSSCGMYDFAGAWVYRVGMPAKSGVGGGIIAVLPGQFGIGVFSPALDAVGNSVRGVAVCEALSQQFSLHQHRPPLNVRSVIRASYTLKDRRSKRRRSPDETAQLDAAGDSVRIIEAHGPMVLSTAESLIRMGIEQTPAGGTLVIDFQRVEAIDSAVAALFGSLAVALKKQRGQFVISGVGESRPWTVALSDALSGAVPDGSHCYADLDSALEGCEEHLLGNNGLLSEGMADRCHPLILELPPKDAAALLGIAARRDFAAGTKIIGLGETSDAIYLLLSGVATVSVPSASGGRHRLSTFGPGTTFGELAMMDHGTRSADVDADTDVLCLSIPVEVLRDEPGMQSLRGRLMEILARDLSDRLRRANAEIQALAR